MELKIQNQENAPLLSLKKISGEIIFTGATPSYKELKEELAKKFNIKQELVQVRHIYTGFREQVAKFEANLYENEKVLKQLLDVKEREKAGLIAAKPKKQEETKEKKE